MYSIHVHIIDLDRNMTDGIFFDICFCRLKNHKKSQHRLWQTENIKHCNNPKRKVKHRINTDNLHRGAESMSTLAPIVYTCQRHG